MYVYFNFNFNIIKQVIICMFYINYCFDIELDIK